MFFSKFVFLEVIDLAFGSAVEITSLVGLILTIAVMVIVSRVIEVIDRRLADDTEFTPLVV